MRGFMRQAKHVLIDHNDHTPDTYTRPQTLHSRVGSVDRCERTPASASKQGKMSSGEPEIWAAGGGGGGRGYSAGTDYSSSYGTCLAHTRTCTRISLSRLAFVMVCPQGGSSGGLYVVAAALAGGVGRMRLGVDPHPTYPQHTSHTTHHQASARCPSRSESSPRGPGSRRRPRTTTRTTTCVSPPLDCGLI